MNLKLTDEESHFLESLLKSQTKTCEMIVLNTPKWGNQSRIAHAKRDINTSSRLIGKLRDIYKQKDSPNE